MSGRREALVVAVHDYADPGLSRLRAPSHDADALARVLGDRGVGGFHVRQLRNEPAHVVSEVLEDFFADRDRDDVLLVYFSGHGLKDEDGTLHLAATNTKVHRLAATSVSASFVNQQMTRSRSRRIVLMLDCCYAGAFARGLTPRGAASDLGIDQQLGGRGRAVITSSSAMEYSFEGSRLTGDGATEPSVFTGVLVRGLETGAADRDGDGFVTLDEIYDYVYTGVREITPHQTPSKWIFDMQGSLHIARRATGPVAAVAPASVRRPRRARWRWAVAGLTAGLLTVGIPVLSHNWPQASPAPAPPSPAASSALPAGLMLFHDDFTTNKGGWPDKGSAALHGGYYLPGAYRFQSRDAGSVWGSSPRAAAAVYPTAPSSIRISVWARWSAPDDLAWFGLACRVVGDLEAYYFVVADSAVHIVKMTSGIPRFPALASDGLRGVDLRAGVRLEADCADAGAGHATRLALRIDGRQVLEATDTTAPLAAGTVGVAVEMNQSARSAEAEFKDFTVTRL